MLTQLKLMLVREQLILKMWRRAGGESDPRAGNEVWNVTDITRGIDPGMETRVVRDTERSIGHGPGREGGQSLGREGGPSLGREGGQSLGREGGQSPEKGGTKSTRNIDTDQEVTHNFNSDNTI